MSRVYIYIFRSADQGIFLVLIGNTGQRFAYLWIKMCLRWRFFGELINGFHLLTVFTKSFILEIP